MNKEAYEASEFVSKQMIVPFGGMVKTESKPSQSQQEEDVDVDLSEFNKLFIELFGKAQFDKCPLLMDKFRFIGKHWDSLE